MKILITGATNGMGKGVARTLSEFESPSHEIIILYRSNELGLATMKELEGLRGNPTVSMVQCDLSKLDNVRKAIVEIKSQHSFLDAIFINAGIGYAARRIETIDGMDTHFQVNYLSQFMLTLNLLELLENSQNGGKVIYNVTEYGEIHWHDMQMNSNWGFEKAIYQAMAAKRMFVAQLHNLCNDTDGNKLSFIGFRIHKTVWSNQINIIPGFMKVMAKTIKFFGVFISIDECGRTIAPLFFESQEESLKKSGKLITWKKNNFVEMPQKEKDLDPQNLNKLWNISLELCNDPKTSAIADKLIHNTQPQ